VLPAIRIRLSGRAVAGETWGGLAAMLVALPSAIAFGVAIYSPMGPACVAQGAMAGILGALAMGLVAPLCGGTPRLISAPCAPAAAVMGALTVQLVATAQGTPSGLDPTAVVTLITIAALMSGVFQFLFGVIGGGRLIKYVPYPVVSGYLSSVGVIIFLHQLPNLFGFPKKTELLDGLLTPHFWRWQALAVGGVTMAAMLLAPRLTRRIPAAMVGLLAGIATYLGLGLSDPKLLVLADNPLLIGAIGGNIDVSRVLGGERWAQLTAVSFSQLRAMFEPAMTLALLLSIDTLKTCVVLDALTRSRHDSNRELRGQGLANIVTAVVGGVPGAGTMGATLINVASGGTTRVSGALEGLFVLGALLIFGPWIGWVPLPALAGILMVVAFRMVDRSCLHLLRHKSTVLDFSVIGVVMVVAVTVNLIAASATGVGLAILLFIRDQIRGSVVRRKLYGDELSSKQCRKAAERAVLEHGGHQTVICQLQGNLFFGTTDQLMNELRQDLATCKYVVLDLARVQGVDFTAAHMLEQIETMLTERGGRLILSNIPASLPTGQDVQAYLGQLGVHRSARSALVLETLDDALEWTEDRILDEQGIVTGAEETPLGLIETDLFRDLGEPARDTLRACVEERSCANDEVVFHKKDKGDEIFVVRRGKVRINLPLKRTGKYMHIATVGRGDFFGEIAFLTGKKRTMDAVAAGPTDLYVMPRARFDDLCRQHPALGTAVLERLACTVALRLRDTDKELRRLQDS